MSFPFLSVPPKDIQRALNCSKQSLDVVGVVPYNLLVNGSMYDNWLVVPRSITGMIVGQLIHTASELGSNLTLFSYVLKPPIQIQAYFFSSFSSIKRPKGPCFGKLEVLVYASPGYPRFGAFAPMKPTFETLAVAEHLEMKGHRCTTGFSLADWLVPWYVWRLCIACLGVGVAVVGSFVF